MIREILKELDENGLLDANEIYGEYESQKSKSQILITGDGLCEIKGTLGMILALYTQLSEVLCKEIKGCTKEKLQNAFDLAFKTDEELDKELLTKFKDMLEGLKKDLEEREQKENE